MRAVLLILMLLIAAAPIGGCDSSSPTLSEPKARLDLNRATVNQLEALPAIGPHKARSIMASRNARGGKFKRLEDLLEIDGIGAKTLEAIRPYVELSP